MSVQSDELRLAARKRIEERRGFIPHLLVYIMVNGGFVALWAVSGHGFFWPGFVIGFWGIGLVMHAWNVLFNRPITEADIQREIQRIQRRSTA